MKTKLFKASDSDIKEASEIIVNGGLVAFPTETVYGLGADGLNSEAVKKIFEAKGRPQDNPLILHISSFDMLDELAYIDERTKEFLHQFWPGALTAVLIKKETVPSIVSAGLDSVGIRMPDNEIALKLIKESKRPIAAPSANVSGYPSPTKAEHVMKDMSGRIDAIIDGGECSLGIESTVVDLRGDCPVILRPGKVTLEDIKKHYKNVRYDEALINMTMTDRPISPGQKYRHYAPSAEVLLLSCDDIRRADESIKLYMTHKNSVILALSEDIEKYAGLNFYELGSSGNPFLIMHRMFDLLRKADNDGYDYIIAPYFKKEGIYMSITNRLEKAGAYNIIEVED